MDHVIENISSLPEEWLPVFCKTAKDGLLLEWVAMQGKDFTEPFFDDTIHAARAALPQGQSRYRSYTSPAFIAEYGHQKMVTPAAIIFHVSRCGSTLLTQLLSRFAQHRVLSEVPVFDQFLRLGITHLGMGKSYIQKLFLNTLALYAQAREPYKAWRVFIKTDSWHLHFYDAYRDMFPGVPFILLYRSPIAVLRSQQKQRGMHAVPGLLEPAIFGIKEEEPCMQNLDHYLARVLESYYKTMLQIARENPQVLLFNYDEGIHSIGERVMDWLHLPVSENEKEKMAARSAYHAKKPWELFSEASASNQTPAFLAAAMDAYKNLDEYRKLLT